MVAEMTPTAEIAPDTHPAETEDAAPFAVPRRLITSDEWEQMIAHDVFPESERLELIHGGIVPMSPISANHVRCVNVLNRVVSRCVDDTLFVSIQNPIRLPDNSQPLPDLAVYREGTGNGVADAADVLLVVEVSHSSLAYDRRVKMPLYAAAGIAEAWIVDLAGQTVERYTEPRDGIYRLIARALPGDTLASVVLPAMQIEIAALLH